MNTPSGKTAVTVGGESSESACETERRASLVMQGDMIIVALCFFMKESIFLRNLLNCLYLNTEKYVFASWLSYWKQYNPCN